MADTLSVRAVPGAAFMGNSPGEYVGYRKCAPDSPDVVFRVGNGGPAYALDGVATVKNCADVRRAIAKGDLALADEGAPTTSLRAPRAAKEG